jgi:hypothetical protein
VLVAYLPNPVAWLVWRCTIRWPAACLLPLSTFGWQVDCVQGMWEVCAGTASLTRSVAPFLSPAAAPSLPVVALWHVAAPHLGLLLMHASHAGSRGQLAALCLSLWSSRPRGALRQRRTRDVAHMDGNGRHSSLGACRSARVADGWAATAACTVLRQSRLLPSWV